MEKQKVDQFRACAKYVQFSAYKLRPLADVVRGKEVEYALNWLTTYKNVRSLPIKKVLQSAVANAENRENIDPSALVVKDIRIDQGPMRRYFKPGAQGRAKPQRMRMCHISVVLQAKDEK